MQIARQAPSLRVSTRMGRLCRRASEAVGPLLILSRSSSSQPILVETRSVKDLIRGSLAASASDYSSIKLALRHERYSMILSARSSNDCGMLIPWAFAAFKLITSSNFVGCSTGSVAGFAPLKILSTYTAARPYSST
jgi:hypothetical protein